MFGGLIGGFKLAAVLQREHRVMSFGCGGLCFDLYAAIFVGLRC